MLLFCFLANSKLESSSVLGDGGQVRSQVAGHYGNFRIIKIRNICWRSVSWYGAYHQTNL